MPTRQSITVDSPEPMKIARALLMKRYKAPSGRSSLLNISGQMWLFDEVVGRWRAWSPSEFKNDLHLALEDVSIAVPDKETGNLKTYRYAQASGSFRGKVEDVYSCIRSLVATHQTKLPFFRGTYENVDPLFCVACENLIVEVTPNGFQTHPLEPDLFVTPARLPVPWDPEAKSELWERVLGEWSGGEEGWVELLQRWWGYCLLPFRGYATWMYMYGKVRAGKGLQMNLMKDLLGGNPAFLGLDMENLVTQFGLYGVQNATVLGISEVNEMVSRDGEKAAAVLKKFLGQDAFRIPIKYDQPLDGVVCDPAPWICGNEILSIGNKGDGLSSKMIPLHFKHSFAGKTDVTLPEKLRLEENQRAIVAWALEGARKLVASKPEDRWPLPQSSKDVMDLFRIYNNPFEPFLRTYFVPKEGGVVASSVVKRYWAEFSAKNRVRNVGPNMLLLKLEQESGWNIARGTAQVTGAGVPRQALVGLALKTGRGADL